MIAKNIKLDVATGGYHHFNNLLIPRPKNPKSPLFLHEEQSERSEEYFGKAE